MKSSFVRGFALLVAVASAAGADLRAGPSLGFLADRAAAAALADLPAPGEAGPWVRLVVREADHWSAVEESVSRLHQAGYRLAVCLTGAVPSAGEAGAGAPWIESSAPSWTAFVRRAVRTLGGQVEVFEIWDAPTRSTFAPDEYAYLLKVSALAARAEAQEHGATVRIAQGMVDPGALDWQRDLWSRDLAAYADILPVRVRATRQGGCEATRPVFDEAVSHPPAPELWAYVESAEEGAAPAEAIRCLAGPATTAFAGVSAAPEALAREASSLAGLNRLLAQGFAPAPPGKLELAAADGTGLVGARVLGRFVDEEFATLVVLEGGPGALSREGILVLDVPDARDAQIVDPATGSAAPSGVRPAPGAPGRKGATIRVGEAPTVLLYRRSIPPGLDQGEERLDVSQHRGLTVEEILARHQAVRRVEDDRLERWAARGRVDYHFKLAQGGGSFDVGIESNYFWERGAPLEWEQTDYFVNGNRVTWKSIPEIPFIQPEKVVTVPLDLTLDRRYAYRLDGEDKIGERTVYVVAFEPADPNAPLSLYRGRVFIDRETFARLRLSVVQTELDPPVLSNEERNEFRAVPGPDGESFFLMARSDGQQLWTVAGRNVVVTRSLEFSAFQINPDRDEFERRRAEAYRSAHTMLRDTDAGFRYLERTPQGGRTLQEDLDTSQIFAAAGAYKDASIDSVVPLVGFNWFDYDVGRRNIQANVFFAGVMAFANATDPALFGSKLDGTVETTLFALKRGDRLYQDGAEVEDQRVEFRSQNVSVRVGLPLGHFVKLTAIGDFDTFSFARADETSPDFVLPADHHVLTGTLQAEFNRRGFTLIGAASKARRSDWQPWGIPDPGGAFPDYKSSHARYTRYHLSGFKEWYLPRFQKLRVGADWLRGDDLDRFSAFQFNFFGDAGLKGFAGSGIRFDEGLVARGGWSFNLFEAVRFDVSIESARVREREKTSDFQSHTGAGLSGNFIGPWKTLIAIGYGRALASDIPALEGEQEFLLTVFKLF